MHVFIVLPIELPIVLPIVLPIELPIELPIVLPIELPIVLHLKPSQPPKPARPRTRLLAQPWGIVLYIVLGNRPPNRQ